MTQRKEKRKRIADWRRVEEKVGGRIKGGRRGKEMGFGEKKGQEFGEGEIALITVVELHVPS